MNVNTIPALIRGEQQWAVRRAKVPYVAGGSGKASSTDTTTWRSFEDAVNAVAAGSGDGLYYALRTGSGIVGIDLDHCVTNGVIDPWAMVYVRLLNSYTCISASGEGIRILVKGTKTSTDCKRGPVECYDHDRFLSITDQRVPGTPDTIEERSDELAAFMQLAFPPKPKSEPKMSTARPTVDLSGDVLFAAAMRDQKFARLHSGNITGYSSPSEARMAYLFKAAFYSRRDADLMDTWFRASSLDQAKWDSKRGVGTLGSFEIPKAIDGCSDIYDPQSSADLAEGLAAVQEAEEIVNSAGSCCGGCACDCCTKRRPLLERTVQTARQQVMAMTAIRKSTGLSGKHKSVADALLLKVEDARRRGLSEVKIFYGDRTARKEGRDPGGLARDAGTSPSTVGTLVEELRKHDASPYEFKTVEGDNGLPRVVVKFDPTSTMVADAAAIAALKREKAQHGGKRIVCPDHPTAPLIRTTICSAPGCGQIVDHETIRVDPQSTGSKLLQAAAAATARRRDEQVSQVATRVSGVEPARPPDAAPGPLQHDATGPARRAAEHDYYEDISQQAFTEGLAKLVRPSSSEPPPSPASERLQHHATGGSNGHVLAAADYGFDPVDAERQRQRAEIPIIVRETLSIGGPLGFPPLPVNGTILRGRQEWERLADPSMLPYLPDAYRAAEYLAAQRDQANV